MVPAEVGSLSCSGDPRTGVDSSGDGRYHVLRVSVRTWFGRAVRSHHTWPFRVLAGYDHFSLPPCIRGRHPTVPFPHGKKRCPRKEKKGGDANHRPEKRRWGRTSPRRAGRSPKEGDRSSTVAETGRAGCGSTRGTRSQRDRGRGQSEEVPGLTRRRSEVACPRPAAIDPLRAALPHAPHLSCRARSNEARPNRSAPAPRRFAEGAGS